MVGLLYSLDDDTEGKTVVERSWICWATVWCHWVTVGKAEASDSTELLALHIPVLCATLGQSPALRELFSEYASLFHERLCLALPPRFALPNDLDVAQTDHLDIVWALSHEQQMVVGKPALDLLLAQKWRLRLGKKMHHKLCEELQSGRSLLLEAAPDEISEVAVRVVALTAGRLVRCDGCVLVSLFKLKKLGKKYVTTAYCQLPGCIQKRKESPESAAQRIVDEQLSPLADFVRLLHFERQDEQGRSEEYRLQTTYLRSVFHAQLSEACPELPTVENFHFESRRDPLAALCTAVLCGWNDATVPRLEDCFFLSGGNTVHLCAWITTDQWDALRGPQAARKLARLAVSAQASLDRS